MWLATYKDKTASVQFWQLESNTRAVCIMHTCSDTHTRPRRAEVFTLRGITHTHTHILFYDIWLLLHTFERVCHITALDCTAGGHLHVVIGSTYHCCWRWVRERHAGLNVPHKRTTVFCASYLHVRDSRVRLMPSEMEYDIFARADTESAPVRVTGVSADRFIYFTAYFLCVFVRLDAANATEPSQRMSAWLSAEISAASRGASTLESPTIIRLSAKCSPRPCFCPHRLVRVFLPSSLSYLLCIRSLVPRPPSLPALLNSHLFTLFLQESTFQICLSVWPSFSCLISFFLHPSEGTQSSKDKPHCEYKNTQCAHQTRFFFSTLLKKWQQNGFRHRLCCRSSHLQTFPEWESLPT